MANDYSLRNSIHFSGTPDEDGDFLVSARSTTLYMTRKEVRQLRDHLDALLNIDPIVGKEVTIVTTSHRDLRGKTGRVRGIMPSGNLDVLVGNESLIVSRKHVVLA